MKTNRFLTLAAFSLAALCLCSCASHQDNIPPELAQQANLQADVDALKQQVRSIKGDVEDIKYQLTAINDEGGFTELAGRVRKLEANVNTIASQLAVDLGGAQSSVRQTPGADADAQAATAQIMNPAPVAAPAVSPVRADEPAEALYAKAMKAFDGRNYTQAQSLWAEFAKNYPKHTLTGNAWFWEGEAYFQMNDFANAALAYNEVITKFPKNGKVQSAYLKQGQSFIKLGNKKAGDLVFQDLIKKFPDTAEAKRAKSLLAGN